MSSPIDSILVYVVLPMDPTSVREPSPTTSQNREMSLFFAQLALIINIHMIRGLHGVFMVNCGISKLYIILSVSYKEFLTPINLTAKIENSRRVYHSSYDTHAIYLSRPL